MPSTDPVRLSRAPLDVGLAANLSIPDATAVVIENVSDEHAFYDFAAAAPDYSERAFMLLAREQVTITISAGDKLWAWCRSDDRPAFLKRAT